MHRIRSDQLYHHYLGDLLQVLIFYPDGSGAVTIGVIAVWVQPRGIDAPATAHTGRVSFHPSRLVPIEALVALYPDFHQEIHAFTGRTEAPSKRRIGAIGCQVDRRIRRR